MAGLRGSSLRQSICLVLVAVLACLLTLNMYSNDPVFAKIDSSAWTLADDGRSPAETYVPSQRLGHRGYTMCVMEDAAMMTNAKYFLTQLRREWKSALPVAFAHCSELPQRTQDELHRLHREAVLSTPELRNNVTALSSAVFEVTDLCRGASVSQKKRLRGFFCKVMSVISAPFRDVMLMDTDVVWLKNPDLLFEASLFKRTGALFFRDRLLFSDASLADHDGLQHGRVKAYIKRHAAEFGKSLGLNTSSLVTLSPTDERRLYEGVTGTAANYFWKEVSAVPAGRELNHVQESSVVLMDRERMIKTMRVMHKLLPTFKLGYGDKEIYWIAATIAGDPFSFEPYFAGTYGDCGEVLHFDPDVRGEPFFINGQFISEGVRFEGMGLQAVMSRPVAALPDVPLPEMGDRDEKTGGNCGGCAAAGGCTKVPTDVTAAIVRQQQFQLKHGVDANFANTFSGILYHAARRIKNKVLPSFLN